MEKTLGQIYFEAAYPNDKWDLTSKTNQMAYENCANGYAAVARHVIDERLAPYGAALKAMAISAVVEAAKQDMASEQQKIGPNAWAARPWEMSEKPVDPPQAEAGDWAMECVRDFRGESFGMYGGERGDGPSEYDKRIAAKIREAAERHYAKQINMLKAVIDAGRDAEAKLRQERDALRDSSTVDHAKRIADRLDAAEAECERLKQQIGNCVLDGKSLRACLQTLSVLHTDRRLVEMVDDMFHPPHDPPAEKQRGDDMANRAEDAEAALDELRKAVNKHARSLEAMFAPGSSPLYRIPRHEWRVSPTDAILAAYRANKAATVAEEVVVK